MSTSLLQKWFPKALSPTICNAPMMGVVTPALAVQVTKAGGIGFISCIADVNHGSPQLAKLDADLVESQRLLGVETPASGHIDVGIGFITAHDSISKFSETVVPIVENHRPAAVWLFAPDETAKPHRTIIQALKAIKPPPKVFVQVGNVATAREALQDGADVLVCQGIDAGGHQFRRGMGVVSLVPEVRNMIEEEAPAREVAVVAAGGIADGRGVAAALALGADGAVLGTRFTVSDESIYPDFKKEQVLKTVDGGNSTFKSPFNDQIQNSTLWGPLYDGRAITSPLHEKFISGASLEDCHNSLKQDYSEEESAKMVNTWAGTGVGLVKKAQPAGDIVREVRAEAKAIIQNLARLQ